MDYLECLDGGGIITQIPGISGTFEETFQSHLPEEDEYFQLHLDIQYHPDDKIQFFSDAIWNGEIEEDYFTLARNLGACLSF